MTAERPRRPRRPRTSGRTPWPLGILALIGTVLLVVPLLGLLVRTPWGDLGALLLREEVLDALLLSLLCATAATVISLVLGVPLAWVLARSSLPGIGLVRALVTLPLVLPPVVGGVALLLVLGRRGLAGRYLDLWFGFTVPFSTTAVILAETFVAMPFLVIAVEGAFRSANQGYDEAAATLGADRLSVFWRVTLPLVRPALVAGAVLCWARALGEFGATITFAGSVQGVTRTAPLEVYLLMQTDTEAAIALSLVLLAVSVSVLLVLRGRWVTSMGPS